MCSSLTGYWAVVEPVFLQQGFLCWCVASVCLKLWTWNTASVLETPLCQDMRTCLLCAGIRFFNQFQLGGKIHVSSDGYVITSKQLEKTYYHFVKNDHRMTFRAKPTGVSHSVIFVYLILMYHSYRYQILLFNTATIFFLLPLYTNQLYKSLVL